MATTYLTPGVYVEEVAVEFGHADRRRHGDRRVRRLHREGTDGRSRRPEGIKPRLVTSWTQFEALYGGIMPEHHAAALRCTATSTMAAASPTSCASRTRCRRPKSSTLALPAADRTLGPAVEFTTVEPRRQHRRERHAGGTGRRRPPTTPSRRSASTSSRTARCRRVVPRPDARQGTATRRVNKEATKVKVATKIDLSASTPISPLPPGRHVTPSSQRPTPITVSSKAFAGSETARTGHQRPRDRRGRDDGDGPRPDHRRHEGRRARSTSTSGRPCSSA